MDKFPTFKRGGVQAIYKKFPKKEQDIIELFVKYVSITSSSDKRLENNRRTLTQFRYIIGKDFDKTTLQDLRDYLSLLKASKNTNATQNEFKASVKRFLKWRFEDWSKRFQNLEDIKLHMKMNEKRINSETLLSKEDVEKIVKASKKTFWKAFFLTLYESGLRPIELRTLTWNRIKFDVEDNLTEINIYATKTSKARSVYVNEAAFFLKKLKEQREDQNNPLVFPSNRDSSVPISKGVLSLWLTQISEKVLGRKVFPYLLRHSRATELYTNANIPDKIAQKFLGHNKSMGDVYTHLSNKDVKEAVGKTIYKFEDMPEEKKHELELKVEKLTDRLDKYMNSRDKALDELGELKKDHKKLKVLLNPDFLKKLTEVYKK